MKAVVTAANRIGGIYFENDIEGQIEDVTVKPKPKTSANNRRERSPSFFYDRRFPFSPKRSALNVEGILESRIVDETEDEKPETSNRRERSLSFFYD